MCATLISRALRYTILGMVLWIGCASGGDPSTSTSESGTESGVEVPDILTAQYQSVTSAAAPYLSVPDSGLAWTRTGPCTVTSYPVPDWVTRYDDRGVSRSVPSDRRVFVYQSCECGAEQTVITLEGHDVGNQPVAVAVSVPVIPCDPPKQ